ncbi:MAG: MarR family transcriptional regulator [Magnetospirillum sp. WYHS-4]
MSRRTNHPPPSDLLAGGIDYDILPDLLGFHLRRAQISVFSRFGRVIARDGITPGQFGILAVIGGNDSLTQSALSKAMGVERSTMVAVIDSLEGKGLVERRPSPDDRRSYALALTDDGKTLLARLKRKVRDHERRVMEDFTEEERRQLVDLLRRVWAGW